MTCVIHLSFTIDHHETYKNKNTGANTTKFSIWTSSSVTRRAGSSSKPGPSTASCTRTRSTSKWRNRGLEFWFQFDQHFTHAFFVWKFFAQLFSSYVWAKKHFCTKIVAHVKFWWNWHLVSIWPTILFFDCSKTH